MSEAHRALDAAGLPQHRWGDLEGGQALRPTCTSPVTHPFFSAAEPSTDMSAATMQRRAGIFPTSGLFRDDSSQPSGRSLDRSRADGLSRPQRSSDKFASDPLPGSTDRSHIIFHMPFVEVNSSYNQSFSPDGINP